MVWIHEAARHFFNLLKPRRFSAMCSSYKLPPHLPCSFLQIVLCSFPQSCNLFSSRFIMSAEGLNSLNSAMNEVIWVKNRSNNTSPLLWCDQKHLFPLPWLNILLFPSSWQPFIANPRDASQVFYIRTDQSTEYLCCLHCFRVLGYVLGHRIAFIWVFLTRRIYSWVW